jgi:hypothetical protein
MREKPGANYESLTQIALGRGWQRLSLSFQQWAGDPARLRQSRRPRQCAARGNFPPREWNEKDGTIVFRGLELGERAEHRIWY